jgi:hypothetical protein
MAVTYHKLPQLVNTSCVPSIPEMGRMVQVLSEMACHFHGAAEGHREAHSHNPESPYEVLGYNLAFAGKWEER